MANQSLQRFEESNAERYIMNKDWLLRHTVYVTLHGSQAYGLANELSDVDVEGICVPPPEVEYSLFGQFEQEKNSPFIETKLGHLKNPKNPKFESTIFSLRKFFILASEVNPNIIEVLWTDPKDHYICHPLMMKVLDNKHLFLSNKARYTFAGYAAGQAKLIERHRKWIVMGEVPIPNREDFGLPKGSPKGLDEISGFVKAEVERWNLNQYPLSEQHRAELKNTLWEIVSTFKEINIANWPEEYAKGIIFKMQKDYNLTGELVQIILAERAYAKAVQLRESWLSWKRERNPARRALEEKCGYDSKHASHLVRLMRMGYEILTTGKVNVNRQGIDADEIKAIKAGAWSFDKVMEFKAEMETKLTEEYARQKQLIAEGKPTPIPREVDKEKINALYHELYNRYWDDDRKVGEYFNPLEDAVGWHGQG
jgi:hypothetical protein